MLLLLLLNTFVKRKLAYECLDALKHTIITIIKYICKAQISSSYAYECSDALNDQSVSRII